MLIDQQGIVKETWSEYDGRSDCSSELSAKIHNVFCDSATPDFLAAVFEIGIPASLSSFLCQATYLVNFYTANQEVTNNEKIAIGIGYILT